jgi:hypothetical protein
MRGGFNVDSSTGVVGRYVSTGTLSWRGDAGTSVGSAVEPHAARPRAITRSGTRLTSGETDRSAEKFSSVLSPDEAVEYAFAAERP